LMLGLRGRGAPHRAKQSAQSCANNPPSVHVLQSIRCRAAPSLLGLPERLPQSIDNSVEFSVNVR
jgi:hypothetical protein